MKTFAFIFARGGSKGLPGKNVLSLDGLPLIAYSIKLARDLDEISEVFVSTDCEEIANISSDFEAEVIFRPKELATDTSPELDSWQHAIKVLQDSGRYFDRFISLPATAPLRSKEDVVKALEKFDDSSDLIVTITESQRSPYFNMVKVDDSGYIENILKDEEEYVRRQDAPISFDLTTVAYVSCPKYILTTTNIFKGRVKGVNIPKKRSIDIDDKLDFDIAEMIIKSREDVK